MTPGGGDRRSAGYFSHGCNVQVRPGSRDGRPRLPSNVGLSTPEQTGEHDLNDEYSGETLYIHYDLS